MNVINVTMVRIYITEGEKLLKPLVDYLKNEVRGVSVFRAISGFGDTGTHTASLLDLSLNLPLVVEFFDHAEKVKAVLTQVLRMVKPEHLVFWEAQTA